MFIGRFVPGVPEGCKRLRLPGGLSDLPEQCPEMSGFVRNISSSPSPQGMDLPPGRADDGDRCEIGRHGFPCVLEFPLKKTSPSIQGSSG
jgi:hypothetical protein